MLNVIVIVVLLAGIVALMLDSIVSRKDAPAISSDSREWIDRFCLHPYRPMERLAGGADALYLGARNPQETPRNVRLQRRLLRGYRKSLTRDYDRLYAAGTGRSFALSKRRIDFIFLIMNFEAGLFWGSLRSRAIRQDVQPLFKAVEALAIETRLLLHSRSRA